MDEDGTITGDEFACIIQSALGVPDLDVSMLFKEIDADETGKLSYGKLTTSCNKEHSDSHGDSEGFLPFFSLKLSDGSDTLFLETTAEA